MAEDSGDTNYTAPDNFVSGEVDDLATLTNLTEDILVQELEKRYETNNIYTFVSDILVAVNPFQKLGIYGPDATEQYNKKARFEVKPHVFCIADACYHNMFNQKKNQCAIISGESGAGKTESAKYIINHIINLCKAGSYGTNLEDQILLASPILEAFGNAQTVMNHNSSRFGKYTRLLFDKKGSVMGVQISEYLLEKSRVVEQAKGERNFHIFYYLFAAENAAELKLSTPDAYKSLGGGLREDNAEMYAELKQAFDVVGFSEDNKAHILKVLAACIHLRNVEFELADEHSAVTAATQVHLDNAAEVLGVAPAALSESLLGLNTTTRGETIRRHYDVNQSEDCRDALAKSLYASLFGWVVHNLNQKLAPELHQRKAAGDRPGKFHVIAPSFEIGVLDIFGFENFSTNSFEQLCINLAHEQLQFFFNRHTFKLELEEYVKEGIDMNRIKFRDNEPLINMFLDKPVGILSILDEECTFPKATTDTLLEKLNTKFENNDTYSKQLPSAGKCFAIEHFAGTVVYTVTHFIDKNRDNLAGDIVEVLQDSSVQLVNDVFNGEILSTGQIRPKEGEDEGPRMHRGKEVVNQESGNTARRRAPTLSTQFRNSLTILVERMTACYPHFVRCIKPNQEQAPNKYVEEDVRKQLLYTGVLESTRIRQEGYSWRPTFASFVKRYKIVAFPVTKLSVVKASAVSAEKIIMAAGLKNYFVGQTKLFLKYYHLDEMENKLAQFYNDIIAIQTLIRGYFARKRLEVLRERAKMSAAERAASLAQEEAEKEDRARLRAEREAHERQQKELEVQRLLAQAQEAQQLAEAAEAERQSAAAQVRRAEMQELKQQEEHLTEEAVKIRESKELEAEEARQAAIEAQMEAEEQEQELLAAQAELEQLQIAVDQAKKEREAAEAEARNLKLERSKSQMRRKEYTQRKAQEAFAEAKRQQEEAAARLQAQEEAEAAVLAAENAKLEEEKRASEKTTAEIEARLKEMEEEAEQARLKAIEETQAAEAAAKARAEAEERARKAEQEMEAEEQRLRDQIAADEEEARAADYKREDFSLKDRVAQLMENKTSPQVAFTNKTAKGYISKLGSFVKSWKKRFFVMDLNDMTFTYYENDKQKKNKGSINLLEILRVFSPPADEHHEHHHREHLLVVETFKRSFFISAPDAITKDTWIESLNVVADYQPPNSF